MHRLRFEAIGTHWDISHDCTESLKADIARLVADYTQVYSRFEANSLATKMSDHSGRYQLPPHANDLFAFYQSLYSLTGGLVTPLIGSLMNDAGYDKNYRLTATQLHHPLKWEDAMTYDPESHHLDVHQPINLDIGAAGKGQLIDLIADLLADNGGKQYIIDGSGDLRVGHQPAAESIGLEDPHDPTKVIGMVTLNDMSMCSSASNRRAWGEMHHIIDPHTLKPAQDVIATWVITGSCMVADGPATALFFVEPDKLQRFDFQYVIMYRDRSLRYSTNFTGEIFQ